MTSSSHKEYPSRGDLREVSIPSLLASLSRSEFTGTFLASIPDEASGEDAEITREIQFANGHIAWAISTAPDESLRAFLLRSGSINEEQWEEAEEQARQDTLRQALTDLGFIETDELAGLEKGRVTEIVNALFGMQEGEYRLRDRQIPPGTPDLEILLAPLILETVSEWGDRALMEEEIGSLDSIFKTTTDISAEWIGRRGEFKTILEMLDGTCSVGQICAATSLPDTFVGSVVAGLSLVGMVERVGAAKTASPATTGIPDDADFIPVADTRPVEHVIPAPSHAASVQQDDPEETDEFESEEDDETVEAIEELPGDEVEEEIPIVHPGLAARESSELTGDLFSSREDEAPSLYDDDGVPEASRPWFLLGAAAAVGFAALFLVLMAQGRGDAVTLSGSPGSEIADLAPASIDPSPETIPQSVPDEVKVAETPAAEVAPPPQTTILDSERPQVDRGQTSLASGDFAMAARHFGRHVSSHSGDFTIQIAMACQDNTVGKLVKDSGQGSDLFILATKHKGRDCYRVYWGQYNTEKLAKEALQRDVPANLRTGSSKPWVTRLPT